MEPGLACQLRLSVPPQQFYLSIQPHSTGCLPCAAIRPRSMGARETMTVLGLVLPNKTGFEFFRRNARDSQIVVTKQSTHRVLHVACILEEQSQCFNIWDILCPIYFAVYACRSIKPISLQRLGVWYPYHQHAYIRNTQDSSLMSYTHINTVTTLLLRLAGVRAVCIPG